MIETKGLTKIFRIKNSPDVVAVKDLTLSVAEGEVFGFLGPNGAGKTTSVRMLTSLIAPTSGSAWVNGFEVGKDDQNIRRSVGILTESPGLYERLSAWKNLEIYGNLYDVEDVDGQLTKYLQMLNLWSRHNDPVGSFSKGMRQRLVLAMALMNESKILFLDEPTSGLDVKSARLIKRLIKKFNQEGKTILLTTHNIDDANQLCDRVAIMNFGKIVAIDSPEKLKDIIQSVSSVEVSFEKPTDIKDLKFINKTKTIKEGDKLKFYTKNPEKVIFSLIDYSKSSKNKIVSLNTLKPTLEDVFIKLTEKKTK